MTETMTGILGQLEQRRRDLGLPNRVLAERSGLGIASVQRTLGGLTEPRLNTLGAIAETLGVTVAIGTWPKVISAMSVDQMLTARAEEKAKELVALAQASAGLEAQAVGRKALQQKYGIAYPYHKRCCLS